MPKKKATKTAIKRELRSSKVTTQSQPQVNQVPTTTPPNLRHDVTQVSRPTTSSSGIPPSVREVVNETNRVFEENKIDSDPSVMDTDHNDAKSPWVTVARRPRQDYLEPR